MLAHRKTFIFTQDVKFLKTDSEKLMHKLSLKKILQEVEAIQAYQKVIWTTVICCRFESIKRVL